MNILRVIADSLIIYGIMGFCYIKRPKQIYIPSILLIIYQTMELYFLYRGRENSDIFFAHAYFSMLIASLLLFFIQKRFKGWFEHLILLPLCVIPIISGFELCVSWTMKLYLRYFINI